jgi:hypothetical protein
MPLAKMMVFSHDLHRVQVVALSPVLRESVLDEVHGRGHSRVLAGCDQFRPVLVEVDQILRIPAPFGLILQDMSEEQDALKEECPQF